MPQSFYDILGVGITASDEEIKRAFRELARRHHPDVSREPASHFLFLRIAEAYQVLIDPMRRAEHDRTLDCDRDAAGSGGGTAGTASDSERVEAGIDPGTRVDVDFGGILLLCRVRQQQGPKLYLTAPATARRSVRFRPGTPVKLTLFEAGTCLEAETRALEWIWMQPPVVVVGPVVGWREIRRRGALRSVRELAARVRFGPGTGSAPERETLLGRTLDVGAGGASLMLTTSAGVRVGDLGSLAIQIEDDFWCDEVPVRVVRVRNWLRSTGRAAEIGVQLHSVSDEQLLRWKACLARVGVES
jgi:hypothetical protein